MADSTDVAIIGGGTAGCAVAYYLGEAGVKSTIIEREGVGSQASGYAAGGLNPLQGAGIPGPLAEFAWESFKMHHGLAGALLDRTGIDYQLRQVSEIRLAFDDADLPGLQETVDLFMRTLGFAASWTEPRMLQSLDDRVTNEAVGCVFTVGNYSLDSMGFTQALAAAAQRSGAAVRPGTVCGLEAQGGRVGRVLLEDGAIECGQVVLAMGPWSRRAEAWLDAYIPVDPLKGEILRMELSGSTLKHDVSGGSGSLYAKPDGQVWCGVTEEWRGFDRQPLAETKDRILEGVARLLPGIADATLVKHTACLRPVTPDWLPILGRTPGYDNVYLATGAGKKGILLAPAIGKSIADLITGGETDLPIADFSPERFASWS